ncbi:MAG: type II toxin-antitoxin system HicB family antitoxin [Chloroflexi bacterium]|nr:type II toxin-antitoxin system HicB family antitoxin [Chloroflexota bacterium]
MNKQMPPYTTIVQLASAPEGLYYIARHPEIENCFSDGQTVEEALTNLAEVTQMTLEHLLEHHLPIPSPQPFGLNPRDLGQDRASPTNGNQTALPGLQVLPIPS